MKEIEQTVVTTTKRDFLLLILVQFVNHPVVLTLKGAFFQMVLPSSGASCADTGEGAFEEDIPRKI